MKSLLSASYESVTLDEWISEHSSEEEMQSVFLNMDRALKYIHEHGYCVEVFYPTEIEILNQQDNYVLFKKLMELPSDIAERKSIIREDLFHSSLIQLGYYGNCLKYLTPEFVKDNFDSFVQFLPSTDVPYYRGIIQRGASVYFSEFDLERRNRDLAELEKQFGEGDPQESIPLQNKNDNFTNKKINDVIYRQINGLRDSAFVHLLILPTALLTLLLLIGFISWFFSFLA